MIRKWTACLGVWLVAMAQAQAGMTVVTLTDLARLRLESLSFFLVAFVLIALAVKGLWNHLAKALPNLPSLNFSRALALVFLSGLLFYVVLTMISGARELLTPGAWEKQGVGYRLRGGENETPPDKEARRAAMRALRDSIWAYAEANDGAAPGSPFAPGVDTARWRTPSGGFYALVPGVRPGVGRDLLAYEPAAAGPRRIILLADGSIEDKPEDTVRRMAEEPMEKIKP